MNAIIRYFDLLANVRSTTARAFADSGKKLHWAPQWLALFLGIMIQPSFDHYRQHREWVFTGIYGWAFFALIVSVMIFPSVYRNAFDPEKPILVQLGPIFVAGMGWEALLETVGKAAGGH